MAIQTGWIIINAIWLFSALTSKHKAQIQQCIMARAWIVAKKFYAGSASYISY